MLSAFDRKDSMENVMGEVKAFIGYNKLLINRGHQGFTTICSTVWCFPEILPLNRVGSFVLDDKNLSLAKGSKRKTVKNVPWDFSKNCYTL